MTMESMHAVVEIWPCAADEHGIWLVSGGDAWRSPPIPADSEPHWEVELVLASQETDTPLAIHSTSWRPDGPTVVLTYIAALPVAGPVRHRWPAALPISADIMPEVGKPYRHGAAEAPIPRYVDVLHHALRHMSHVVTTDSTTRDALAGYWVEHLSLMEPVLAGMYEAE